MPKGRDSFIYASESLQALIDTPPADRIAVLDGVEAIESSAMTAVGRNAERMLDVSTAICDLLPQLLSEDVNIVPPLTQAHKAKIGNVATHYQVIKEALSPKKTTKAAPRHYSARKA